MKALNDDNCPPPDMTEHADGRIDYKPHCWKCAPKVKSMTQTNRPPPPASSTDPRKKPWKTNDLAQFLIQHCQGTGHTLKWVIENFSPGTTAAETPEEFQRRLRNLYTMMPKIREAVKKLSNGELHLPKQFIAQGLRKDGMANHAALLQVLPLRQQAVL